MGSLKPGIRARRILWGAILFLSLIGVFVVARRTAHLAPILIHGYIPLLASSNPRLAQLVAMDDVFARYPVLTLVHILPGLIFVVLAPLQFSSTFRKRHLKWHRRSGRILFLCGAVIGVSALVMSFAMPSIGGVNQAAATTLFGLWFLFARGKPSRVGSTGVTNLTCCGVAPERCGMRCGYNQGDWRTKCFKTCVMER